MSFLLAKPTWRLTPLWLIQGGKQLIQRLQMMRLHALLQLHLYALPGVQRVAEQSFSSLGQAHQTVTLIGATLQRHQATPFQDPKVTAKRTALQAHGFGQVGDAWLIEALQVPEQRILGSVEPDTAQRVVIEPADATAGTTQASA